MNMRIVLRLVQHMQLLQEEKLIEAFD